MCEALESLYQQEWNSLFCINYYVENLRSLGIKGKLRNSHFRSICWKVLLECLPEDQQLWIDTTTEQRKRYDEILDKIQVNPRKLDENMDISVNNPLSQSQQSPWNQFFQDSELKITIQQDVVRTFPEIEFFHSPRVQDMMNNILFSYARECPHVSYKQGMHELLGPLIFVLHYDQQAYLEVSKTDNLNLDNVRIILNQNYIEHDAFFLFCRLMEAVEAWYTTSEHLYSKCLTAISPEPFSENLTSPVNSIGVKLKNIYKHLLKHHDVELFLYLEQMEITPQIYGIRWLRLLFGREFPIHDQLIIWDAIFSDGIPFDIVDYIFVAMLIAIRDLLLKSDYASCLHHLMHYPNVTDVQYIISLALQLRDPSVASICINQVSDVPKAKVAKETKPSFVRNNFSKNVFSSSSTSASVIKNMETRPKFLNISAVTSSLNDSSANPSFKEIDFEKWDKASEIIETSKTEDYEEPAEVFMYNDKKGSYNTFPRTSIRNVMESKSLKVKPSEVSQSFGHGEDKVMPSGSLYREMVPLVPATKISPTDQYVIKKRITLKDMNDLKLLQEEISEMKLMNEYCAMQISKQISKLQECMIGQSLLYEDEMFIALAGLKRSRDILKGTVKFSDELIDDDQISNYVPHSCNNIHTSDSSSIPKRINLQNFDFELNKNELCENISSSENKNKEL